MKYRIIEEREGFFIQAFAGATEEIVKCGLFSSTKYIYVEMWRYCDRYLIPCSPTRYVGHRVFKDYPHQPFKTYKEAEKYLFETKNPKETKVIKEYEF